MAAQTLFAPITKLFKALNQRGLKGTIIQLYTIGDLKFGELKGTDRWGNKYYENIDLPYGQHRWVEYHDIHDPDPTFIPPEWHGWMHHVYDETPDEEASLDGKYIPTTELSHAKQAFNTHVGLIADRSHEKFPTHNTSQYRLRGYKSESIFTKPGEPEQYWKQPGHPLHPLAEEGGRFNAPKGYHIWDREEEAKKMKEREEKERIEFEKYANN